MKLLDKIIDRSPEEKQTFIYTDEQLMARLRFFIGICLALTLTGIVFVVLYCLWCSMLKYAIQGGAPV